MTKPSTQLPKPRTDEPQESDLPPNHAKPAQRALAGAGYWKLERLAKVSEAEILQLHGMGPKAVGQLRLALAETGLAFADSPRGHL